MRSDQVVYFGVAAAVSIVIGLVAATGALGGNASQWPLTVLGLFWAACAWRLGFRVAGMPLTWSTWRSFKPVIVSLVIFVAVVWAAGLGLRAIGLLR